MSALLNPAKRIAIIGGGPSGLFLYKRLVETGQNNFTVDIFEQKNQLGGGMPYTCEGSNTEHITNVSGNEIPSLPTPVVEWIQTIPEEKLMKFKVDPCTFHEYKVVPRLLFGEYLSEQFHALLEQGAQSGIDTRVHVNCRVADVIDMPVDDTVIIEVGNGERLVFDAVILCTGHSWPLTYEKKVPGYFDSPYPPSKLATRFDHPIAIRGSSLTAIDAIRTVARNNGIFTEEAPQQFSYIPHEDAKDFRIVMHSRNGLLPGIRFHLDDPHLSKQSLLSKEDIESHRKGNGGFLSLDFIFEKDFKDSFIVKDLAFYDRIKHMGMEEFVDMIMSRREQIEPFLLFKGEYAEAKKSIKRKESVYWKEMLAVLSFAMNYPAKHFSAEDMLRLQQVLMPLISIVIAFVPQSSCEELIALHDAGRLDLISVGAASDIEIHDEGGIVYYHTDDTGQEHQTKYNTFIDCIGQRHLSMEAFPFASMVRNNTITGARVKFKDPAHAKQLLQEGSKDIEQGNNGYYYLKVPGIAIDDHFRILNKAGEQNSRIYIMAVSYIGGFNPDYSGLDFCEEASEIIVNDLLR